jgi:hypothetical protein
VIVASGVYVTEVTVPLYSATTTSLFWSLPAVPTATATAVWFLAGIYLTPSAVDARISSPLASCRAMC